MLYEDEKRALVDAVKSHLAWLQSRGSATGILERALAEVQEEMAISGTRGGRTAAQTDLWLSDDSYADQIWLGDEPVRKGGP